MNYCEGYDVAYSAVRLRRAKVVHAEYAKPEYIVYTSTLRVPQTHEKS